MLVKVAVLVLVCMAVTPPPLHVEAVISCGTVVTYLAPCFDYLMSGGVVPPPCCSGVRGLYNAASTTPDRRAACGCIKQAAGSVAGINLDFAGKIPTECHINIPYKIDPSTDCTRVN